MPRLTNIQIHLKKKLDDEGMGEKSVEITVYWKIFSSCLAYTYARIQFQTFFISILFQFAEICWFDKIKRKSKGKNFFGKKIMLCLWRCELRDFYGKVVEALLEAFLWNVNWCLWKRLKWNWINLRNPFGFVFHVDLWISKQ